MKHRMILGLATVVLALFAFYGVWPALTALGIKSALQDRDAPGLESRIDFENVRASLRPAVTFKVAEAYERLQQRGGSTGALVMGGLKNEAVPKLVDVSLRALVTPAMLIRVVHDARPLKETVDRILNEHLGKTVEGDNSGGGGGILGRVLRRDSVPTTPTDPAPVSTLPAVPARKFTLANVKSFAFSGPLSFQIGLAKDPATTVAEITAEMRFIQGTWKITGVAPRF